ncbi:hypothetical protein HanOQP8_Chr05g0171961 [Helianthus annuus]|nr:hypothetical protein HanHA89_Chr05g0174051 [Helianthus annuus]KAJ0745946.1 hypothetical protein HanOQP8_Chr05g0171961 [Helianthus annuus]
MGIKMSGLVQTKVGLLVNKPTFLCLNNPTLRQGFSHKTKLYEEYKDVPLFEEEQAARDAAVAVAEDGSSSMHIWMNLSSVRSGLVTLP